MIRRSAMETCHVGLSVMSIALVMSVGLNIFLYYLRRRDRQNRAVEMPLYQDSFNSDRFEDEERLDQDNPIYGNILVDVVGGYSGSTAMGEYGNSVQMSKKVTRQEEKSDPEDVSYASLDLRVAQKRKKKKRYQERPNQTHMAQTHAAPVPLKRRNEREADCDIALPSRTSSLIVSRSSIYLNSHQVAMETEELQREREREKERETEWRSNHEREMMMKLHGNMDHTLDSLDPFDDQGN